ncbi:MAG: hypothetical protein BJ554DRAFT_4540, partial [Olpidium bornovanus]
AGNISLAPHRNQVINFLGLLQLGLRSAKTISAFFGKLEDLVHERAEEAGFVRERGRGGGFLERRAGRRRLRRGAADGLVGQEGPKVRPDASQRRGQPFLDPPAVDVQRRRRALVQVLQRRELRLVAGAAGGLGAPARSLRLGPLPLRPGPQRPGLLLQAPRALLGGPRALLGVLPAGRNLPRLLLGRQADPDVPVKQRRHEPEVEPRPAERDVPRGGEPPRAEPPRVLEHEPRPTLRVRPREPVRAVEQVARDAVGRDLPEEGDVALAVREILPEIGDGPPRARPLQVEVDPPEENLLLAQLQHVFQVFFLRIHQPDQFRMAACSAAGPPHWGESYLRTGNGEAARAESHEPRFTSLNR